MSLAAIVDKLEDVPEKDREHYVAGTGEHEGRFIASINAVDGFALEDVEGLKKTVSATRTERDQALEKVKGFDGLDPSKVRDALGELEELKKIDPESDAEKKAQARFEALKGQLNEEHLKELDPLKARESKLLGIVENVMLDNALLTSLEKHGGNATLLKGALRASMRLRETDEGFVVEILDEAGNVRIGDSKGTPMSTDQFVEGVKALPEYAVAFKAPEHKGPGTPPGQPPAKPQGGELTSVQKIAAGFANQ